MSVQEFTEELADEADKEVAGPPSQHEVDTL